MATCVPVKFVSCWFQCGLNAITIELTNGSRYKVRGIAHGEVIAFGNNYLARIRVKLFPARLESERSLFSPKIVVSGRRLNGPASACSTWSQIVSDLRASRM